MPRTQTVSFAAPGAGSGAAAAASASGAGALASAAGSVAPGSGSNVHSDFSMTRMLRGKALPSILPSLMRQYVAPSSVSVAVNRVPCGIAFFLYSGRSLSPGLALAKAGICAIQSRAGVFNTAGCVGLGVVGWVAAAFGGGVFLRGTFMTRSVTIGYS